jgi:predicted transcriptional regulator of viral defense system
MSTKTNELIRFFEASKGILRFARILKEGFHRKQVKVLLDAGKIRRMGRGLYQLADAPALSNPDFVSAVLQSPKSVVCLISALSFHEVTDEIPRRVDLAIPMSSRANKIDYPPVKYFYFSKAAWKAGIETHKIDGYDVRVYDLAKTIADCFKFRNKIGFDVAQKALKVAVAEKRIRPAKIMEYAKVCRVANIIRPYLEAFV